MEENKIINVTKKPFFFKFDYILSDASNVYSTLRKEQWPREKHCPFSGRTS